MSASTEETQFVMVTPDELKGLAVHVRNYGETHHIHPIKMALMLKACSDNLLEFNNVTISEHWQVPEGEVQ